MNTARLTVADGAERRKDFVIGDTGMAKPGRHYSTIHPSSGEAAG